jgi:hypothetical protein
MPKYEVWYWVTSTYGGSVTIEADNEDDAIDALNCHPDIKIDGGYLRDAAEIIYSGDIDEVTE